MFLAIFAYIEHLFSKIKPKQLFFMAIDGVAPRAKMNQQRARRFRTALDAERAREKALKEGLEMPKEGAFDSNCITPGNILGLGPGRISAYSRRHRVHGQANATAALLCQ